MVDETVIFFSKRLLEIREYSSKMHLSSYVFIKPPLKLGMDG